MKVKEVSVDIGPFKLSLIGSEIYVKPSARLSDDGTDAMTLLEAKGLADWLNRVINEVVDKNIDDSVSTYTTVCDPKKSDIWEKAFRPIYAMHSKLLECEIDISRLCYLVTEQEWLDLNVFRDTNQGGQRRLEIGNLKVRKA